MGKKRVSQVLFQSVGRDGTDWLFVVGSDGSWAISRNGKEFDIGTGERASVVGGVEKFLSVTRVIASRDTAGDPVVDKLLDRIERGGSVTAKVAKYQRRIRPHASKESPVYLET